MEWNLLGPQRGVDINGRNNNEQFGYSIALSSDGTIIAVGAPYNDNNNNNYAG